MPSKEVITKAKDLIEWNEILPNFRIVQQSETGATSVFMIIADYGWAERILCCGCYLQDAEAIKLALEEAIV